MRLRASYDQHSHQGSNNIFMKKNIAWGKDSSVAKDWIARMYKFDHLGTRLFLGEKQTSTKILSIITF